METTHQKNLKFLLQMELEDFEQWLGTLPDPAMEYIEWLFDEVEYTLDDIAIETVGLDQANKVIQKYTLHKS